MKIAEVGTLWRSNGLAAPLVLQADGCVDLILRDDELLVAGPSTRAFVGRGSSRGETLGIRFLPGLANSALGRSLLELRDLQLDASDVLTPSRRQAGLSLLRRLRDANGSEVVEVASADIAAEYSLLPATQGWTAVAREAAVLGESAAALARRLTISERQLHRRMVASFGYGYTALRRVVHAQRARAMLRAGVASSEIAYRAGYCDQAHFTREFLKLAGTTPGSFTSVTQA
ncbi:helix-turn-helix transcriptional regulator [Leucobacter insecticola]|uniref:Helix-turn-helix transcriptional regulator n=1 Tax=Leucobacter insecticola TaxID=2714934 RepID=A0A6G8FKB6_9MICO|nr:helix-turn-helix transcriptional regulator [Leucobacter insecticola]QIM16512.1 helix-turn-helix transcriptional regulator [Leucobacter insecticola]